MQVTITGTLEEISEEIRALAERFLATQGARANNNIATPTPEPAGVALEEMVKSQTGNNRKLLDFLIRNAKVAQSGDSVAAELSIQLLQLNGNIGALNNKSVKLTGHPIITKKKRGRKMYYTINPLVLGRK
jgi:hypothetical protein